jgi:hypothetical protein
MSGKLSYSDIVKKSYVHTEIPLNTVSEVPIKTLPNMNNDLFWLALIQYLPQELWHMILVHLSYYDLSITIVSMLNYKQEFEHYIDKKPFDDLCNAWTYGLNIIPIDFNLNSIGINPNTYKIHGSFTYFECLDLNYLCQSCLYNNIKSITLSSKVLVYLYENYSSSTKLFHILNEMKIPNLIYKITLSDIEVNKPFNPEGMVTSTDAGVYTQFLESLYSYNPNLTTIKFEYIYIHTDMIVVLKKFKNINSINIWKCHLSINSKHEFFNLINDNKHKLKKLKLNDIELVNSSFKTIGLCIFKSIEWLDIRQNYIIHYSSENQMTPIDVSLDYDFENISTFVNLKHINLSYSSYLHNIDFLLETAKLETVIVKACLNLTHRRGSGFHTFKSRYYDRHKRNVTIIY